MKTMRTVEELNTIIIKADQEISLDTAALQDLYDAEATQKELKKATDDLKDKIAQRNADNLEKLYAGFLLKKKPMLEAAKYGAVKEKNLVVKTDPKYGKTTVEVRDRLAADAIDLADFDLSAPKQQSANGQWKFWACQLLKSIVYNAGKDLGLGDEERKELGKLFKEAKAEGSYPDLTAKNPSKTSITRDLQCIVDAIMFEQGKDKDGNPLVDKDGNPLNTYKVTSADARYVQICAMKKGKTLLSVRAATENEVKRVIGNVMHRIVTEKHYTVE